VGDGGLVQLLLRGGVDVVTTSHLDLREPTQIAHVRFRHDMLTRIVASGVDKDEIVDGMVRDLWCVRERRIAVCVMCVCYVCVRACGWVSGWVGVTPSHPALQPSPFLRYARTRKGQRSHLA
jgi:hypothetical protein